MPLSSAAPHATPDTRAATRAAPRNPASRFMMASLVALSLAFVQTMPAQAQDMTPGQVGVPLSFADLAQKVSPAVVNITTTTTVAASTNETPMLPEGSPFEEFFRDFMERNGQTPDSRPHRSQALGSGFVISPDGYIVTNNHVIEGADEIQIEFYEGFTLDAKLIGTDPKTDIALLKVEADEPLGYVEFGDSDASRVGDWVMAMGNPLGQGFSVSSGIVSARGRALSGTYDDFIQTDAAINRGNSGGPLFNMDAQVIGVNTAILSPNGGSIGIGFSMASNVVTRVVDQLKEYGETRRGWLGVRIQDVTDDVADAMGLASASGALVTDVPTGPSQDAGVEAGDVITAFDGKPVSDTRELVRTVGNTAVGKAVTMVVVRNGTEMDLTITLGRREDAEGEAVPASVQQNVEEPSTSDMLGMVLSPMTDELRAELSLPGSAEGLVVADVEEDSEAYMKGLRAGDVITEAGQQKIASASDLDARIADAKDAGRNTLLLLVRRGADPRFVALNIAE
nr:DegQ family serine endoprotease [Aquimixticola soesokkakensis]